MVKLLVMINNRKLFDMELGYNIKIRITNIFSKCY